MTTKKENLLDEKSALVDADKIRILNSADDNDSESITYANLKTSLTNDGIGGSGDVKADGSVPFTGDLDLGDNGIINGIFKYKDKAPSTLTVSEIKENDVIYCASTGTFALPEVSTVYGSYITFVRRTATSSTAVIIDPNGSQTINGKTEFYLYSKYSYVRLFASEQLGEWVYNGTPYDPYEIVTEDSSTVNISSPSQGTIYNTGVSIDLLAGSWDIIWNATVQANTTATGNFLLRAGLTTNTSTPTTTWSDNNLRQTTNISADNVTLFRTNMGRSIIGETVSSTTTYNIAIYCENGGVSVSTFRLNGFDEPTKIIAVRRFD